MLISPAITQSHLDEVRTLFKEYAEWMNYELCFDSFEKEMADLPGEYAPPDGALLVAVVDGKIAGCIALRKYGDKTCEMKRLWVKKEYRNLKIGYQLINETIKIAKSSNYKEMVLETTEIMEKALSIYKRFGFKVVSVKQDGKIIDMTMPLI